MLLPMTSQKPRNTSSIHLDALDICDCEFPRVQPQEIRMDAPGQQNWEERFQGWYVPLCYSCRRARTANPMQNLERCQELCDDLNDLRIATETNTSSSVAFLSWDSNDESKAMDLEGKLYELGVKVETVIPDRELGKPISRLIEEKLKVSQIAVIICSKDYLENETWARKERETIENLETHDEIKPIIILYGMTSEELRQKAPLLARLAYIECPHGNFDAKFAAEKITKDLI